MCVGVRSTLSAAEEQRWGQGHLGHPGASCRLCLSHPVVKMVLAGKHFVARVRNLLQRAHGKMGVVVHLHYTVVMTQESRSGPAS